jgi:phage repressor protein C with HTH and peptisase S24 domain
MQNPSIPKTEYAEIGQRLIELRATKNLNQRQAAEALGIKDRTYQNYEYGFSKPNSENLKKILDYYGCSYGWLMAGEGVPFPDRNAPGLIPGPTPVSPDFPPDEFVFIRQVNGKISAGGGLMPDNSADMKIAFRRDWISRKGKPDQMSLIKIDGDSMEPTLLSGDLVLVDHNRNAIAPQGGIYAIAIDHEIMIKRVQPVFPEGKLRVISDNKQYDPFEIATDRLRVNGKVIWFAREMER